MARYSVQDAARLRAMEAELSCLREKPGQTFAWLAPALRDVLGVDRAVVCCLAPRGAGYTIEYGTTVGIPSEFIPATNRLIAGKSLDPAMHHALRPERAQRNRVLQSSDIQRGRDPLTVVMATMYARFGLGRDHAAHVLVCEGGTLLAYVAVLQAAPIEPRQRRMLARLVPSMRRRLGAERLLEGARSTRMMLDAALGAIPWAAFELSELGVVVRANHIGARWLEREGTAGQDALLNVTRRPSRAITGGDLRVTRVVPIGGPAHYLVVRTAEAGALSTLEAAGLRWGLSPREMRVFACVARGMPTRTIAAELAVSVRTVEAHLTSMFAKAQVETRGELLAKGMGGAMTRRGRE